MILKNIKKPAKLAWRILALAMALLMLCGVGASAADVEDVPYYSYTYWEGPSRYEAVPMRPMYEAETQITGDSLGIDSLYDPTHVCLSADKMTLFILDSGNSRILAVNTLDFTLNPYYGVGGIIGQIQSAEDALDYTGAMGIYVSPSNQIYIADTNNYRLLIVDAAGQLIHTLTKPTDIGVPEDQDFQPSRIMMDNKGYLYVVGKACYYGMWVYDTNYNFLGFHGSYAVEQSVADTIKGWITGLFMTNEKNAVSQKKLPAEIQDISIDNDGLLYTLSANAYGQIKRLGLNGNQTLNYKFGFSNSSGDLINFGEQSAREYWHKHYQYKQSLQGITVDPDGFIFAIDKILGRVIMYDEECRVISVFGTGFGSGDQVGTFITPEAVASSSDALYVLDFAAKNVTVFRLTDYGRLFKQADILTMAGEYNQAQPIWEQVLKLDANNQRAYEGIAKSMLSQANAAKSAGDMDAAYPLFEKTMEYAELGNDQQTYSQAFEVIQKDWISTNFWWIFLVCLAAVGGIAALLVLSKKKKIFEIKNPQLRTALSVPFHPFQSFQSLRYQKTGSIRLAILFIVLFYLASVSEDLYGGFMYVLTDTSTYNALYTLIGTVGVLLLWVIVNWGICILNEGKGTLKQVFCMSAYSMTPMIVYSVIFTAASHLLPATDTSTFTIISAIMAIYTVLLLLIGMTVVHEYTFFKAMGMAVMCVLCMLLAAFVIFSVVLLSQQFILFIVGLVDEILLR